MPSSTYGLLAQAMKERKQVVCLYDGHRREFCPIILGHKKGQEVTLAYQFAGGGTKPLPPGGNWRCFVVSNMTDVKLRDGPWRTGSSHQQQQTCVEAVDLDVNPASPYSPKRRL